MPVPGPKRRLALSAVVALVLPVLGLVPSPAFATTEPATSLAGYAEVIDPYVYVSNLRRSENTNVDRVIHVDTEHADEHGFWYARETALPAKKGQRDFKWAYQLWGATCDLRGSAPRFSVWMNTWSCVTTPERAMLYPGADAAKTECEARIADEPWLSLTIFLESNFVTRCDPGTYLAPSRATLHGFIPTTQPDVMDCAPWEAINCLTHTYEWSKNKRDVVPELWRPAPDTCTGLPVDANYHGAMPEPLTRPAEADCSGDELAVNCPEGSLHAACSTDGPREQGADNPAYGWVIDHEAVHNSRSASFTATGTSTQSYWKYGRGQFGYAYSTWRGKKIKVKGESQAIIRETRTRTATGVGAQTASGTAYVTGVGRTSAEATAHRLEIGATAALNAATRRVGNLMNQAFHEAQSEADRNALYEASDAVVAAMERPANAQEKALAVAQAKKNAAARMPGVKQWIERTYQAQKKTKATVVKLKKKHAKAKKAKTRRAYAAKLVTARAAHQDAKQEHAYAMRKHRVTAS